MRQCRYSAQRTSFSPRIDLIIQDMNAVNRSCSSEAAVNFQPIDETLDLRGPQVAVSLFPNRRWLFRHPGRLTSSGNRTERKTVQRRQRRREAPAGNRVKRKSACTDTIEEGVLGRQCFPKEKHPPSTRIRTQLQVSFILPPQRRCTQNGVLACNVHSEFHFLHVAPHRAQDPVCSRNPMGNLHKASSLLTSPQRSLLHCGIRWECAWMRRRTQDQRTTKEAAHRKNPARDVLT